jgi:hypothetical protein
MGDYSNIGDAMVFLAVATALAIPSLIGCFCGLVLAAFGMVIAGLVVGATGVAAGIICAIIVRASA